MAELKITILNKQELLAKFKARRDQLVPAVTRTMKVQMNASKTYAKAIKVNDGQPLFSRSGTLRMLMAANASATGTVVRGTLGDTAPYAHVHERGGTFFIPDHMRRTGYNAKGERTKLLTKRGRDRAAAVTKIPGLVRGHNATYPQRAFLAPSITERRDEIVEALRATVLGVLSAT